MDGLTISGFGEIMRQVNFITKTGKQINFSSSIEEKEKNKKYYDSRREILLAKKRTRYAKNKKRLNRETMKRHAKNRETWKGYIPTMTTCQMCGKDIFFHRRKQNQSIHFDHRHGGTEKVKKPMLWLATKRMTPKNKRIWDSCDFGMLCGVCNRSLPTKDRRQFIVNAMKYVLKLKDTDELIVSCRIKLDRKSTINGMKSGKPRNGNPEPSVQSTKVQRLLEHSDMLNNQKSVPQLKVDDIVRSPEESGKNNVMVITRLHRR